MPKKYTYNGPVLNFNTVVAQKWEASTYASSEKRAKSNLSYRFKKEHGYRPTAKITLPGKLEMVS